jgi:hypothetical protein
LMKPKPLAGLNHFTVPVAIRVSWGSQTWIVTIIERSETTWVLGGLGAAPRKGTIGKA